VLPGHCKDGYRSLEIQIYDKRVNPDLSLVGPNVVNRVELGFAATMSVIQQRQREGFQIEPADPFGVLGI
jgi:hypothetical protein